MDDAVLDGDIGRRNLGPFLRLQLSQQLVADHAVIGVGAARCLVDRHRERAHEVRPADDPNHFAVSHDRHPLDPVGLQQTAISATDVSSVTEMTSRVMTSFTLPLCDFRYSPASLLVDDTISSHHERRRSVPVSARCKRSPSLTMPITRFSLSTTGTALMPCSAISFARLHGRILADRNHLARHHVHRAHRNLLQLISAAIKAHPAVTALRQINPSVKLNASLAPAPRFAGTRRINGTLYASMMTFSACVRAASPKVS